jgi:hypothetical protein
VHAELGGTPSGSSGVGRHDVWQWSPSLMDRHHDGGAARQKRRLTTAARSDLGRLPSQTRRPRAGRVPVTHSTRYSAQTSGPFGVASCNGRVRSAWWATSSVCTLTMLAPARSQRRRRVSAYDSSAGGHVKLREAHTACSLMMFWTRLTD